MKRALEYIHPPNHLKNRFRASCRTRRAMSLSFARFCNTEVSEVMQEESKSYPFDLPVQNQKEPIDFQKLFLKKIKKFSFRGKQFTCLTKLYLFSIFIPPRCIHVVQSKKFWIFNLKPSAG